MFCAQKIQLFVDPVEISNTHSLTLYSHPRLSLLLLCFIGGVGGSAGAPADDPLGSQGALVMSDNGRCLFATNAGSDTITSFFIQGSNNGNNNNNNNNNNGSSDDSGDDDSGDSDDSGNGSNGRNGLRQRGVYDTDGSFPVSIAVHNELLYVLNAGGDGSITGFVMNPNNCRLTPIDSSTRSLSAGGTDPPFFVLSPSQISFSPDGDFLVAVVKGVEVGLVWVFPIQSSGRTRRGVVTPSNGFTPFGFDFDSNGNLLLSEAFGTAPEPPSSIGVSENTGAVTSYRINQDDASLEVISASVGNGQTATCWLQFSESSQCAYTTNNIANTLSTYQVNRRGQLNLVEGIADEVNAPIDHVIVGDFMYVLSTGHTLEGSTRTPQGDRREVGQPAMYVYRIDEGNCDIELEEVVLDGLPNESVTEFGVVGVAAS